MKIMCHVGEKTFWENEKLLFSFSHNVFHIYISLVRQNAALCGNVWKRNKWMNLLLLATMRKLQT